jgi:hypothetical protein
VVEPKASPFGRHAWGRPKTKVAAGLVSEEQRFDFRADEDTAASQLHAWDHLASRPVCDCGLRHM